MSDDQEILALLPPEIQVYLGNPPYTLELVQKNVYHLQSATQQIYLKRIPLEDWHGQNEISVNQALQVTTCFPAPRLLFTTTDYQTMLVGWEWVEGSDLRKHNRQVLPLAFTQLAHFHTAQRNTEPVCSPTTYKSYGSIHEMLQAELAELSVGLKATITTQCAAAFRLLERGFVTRIHGDFHPGNIRVDGHKLQFVDWGYATNSINLFDLGYIQHCTKQNSDVSEWWYIRPPEWNAVLCAYFTSYGMTELQWLPIQWAIEVWSTLYTYSNCFRNDDRFHVTDCLNTLDSLLAQAFKYGLDT
jgi:aminoglycoside phosphotransferase (APT) family kinase protein